MANKNNSRNPKFGDSKDDSRSKSGKAGRSTFGRKASNGKRKSTRNDFRKVDTNSSVETNPLVSSMSIETPMSARSKVFASDSASIQSFGTFTTTPGQDNFIENFNELITAPDAQGQGWTWTVEFEPYTKRTANAMVISITPWFGSTDVKYNGTWLSPLQLAATNLKQYIDTSFGTRTDYDTQDLMMYLLGVYAVFPVIAEIKRNIRLVYTYQQDHYPAFLPAGMFAALHLPAEGEEYQSGAGALYAAQHLRTYIDQLNQLIVTFNRLPMPPELKAFGYNDDLFDAIYMDSDDIKTAQLYIFENKEYWTYEEDAEYGSRLIPNTFGNKNIGARLLVLKDMISNLSALRTSSTAMLQNLFNAYGSRDQVQVPTMDINTLTPVDFVKDDNILTMIDNMVVCPQSGATLSYIVPEHENSNIYGHMWINEANMNSAINLIFNLPLQFHKPFDMVTQEDIGWALRLHPNFCNKKNIPLWDADHVGNAAVVMTADEHIGFAVCRGIRIVSFNDRGTIAELDNELTLRSQVSAPYWVSDFKAHPIFVQSSPEVDFTHLHAHVRLRNYFAGRDVEATYRIQDVAMHWTYLTMEMWGSNVNRNVVGSRAKGIG